MELKQDFDIMREQGQALESLKADLQQKGEFLAAKNEELSSQSLRIEELNSAQTALEQNIYELKQKMQEREKESEPVLQELEALRNEREQASVQLTREIELRQEVVNQVVSLKDQNERIVLKVKDLEERSEACAAWESEINEVKKEKELALEQLEILAKENSRLILVHAEMTEDQKDKESLEAKIREMEKKCAQLCQDKLAGQDNLDALRVANKQAKEEHAAILKENVQLLSNLTELKYDREKMRLESDEKFRELLETGERQSSDRLAMEIRLKMSIEELNKNLLLKERRLFLS